MNLSTLIVFPALSGFLLLFFGKNTKAAQWSNIALQLAWAILAFVVLKSVQGTATEGSFPVLYSWNWFPTLKSRFSLGLDGLNLPLIALNVFLAVTLAFYSLGKNALTS